MLALKRRNGESLTITLPDGRVIVVHVAKSACGMVKLRVHAPQDVQILRTELIGERR